MSRKKTIALILLVSALALSVTWLVLGYRTYSKVKRFDSGTRSQEIGRPIALWPYSMFVGPDPRFDNSARNSQPSLTPEPSIFLEDGRIDLSQVKEEVIRSMYDNEGYRIHPYQKHVDAAQGHPGGYGGYYFEGTVVNLYMEDPSEVEAAEAAFTQMYTGSREITEIRVVQGRYSADKLWDWYLMLETADNVAPIETGSSGIYFGDNQIHFSMYSEEGVEVFHALMDTLEVPRDAVAISCCGGITLE